MTNYLTRQFNFFEKLTKQMTERTTKYPFCNVWFDEDKQKNILEVACAGFKREDLDVSVEDGTLKISGKNKLCESEIHYDHKGISTKKFKLNFDLDVFAPIFEVDYTDGILKLEFVNK